MRFKFAHDAAVLRRLAYLGARHGPHFWLKYSPPVFGVLFALALTKHRRRVRDNLRWVRGRVGIWREQREIFTTFVRYAQCLAEALGTDRAEARQLVRRVSGEGHLLKALETGTGALLVTAHAGPWDAAAQLLRGVIQREVVTVMQSEPNARARDFHDHVRGRGGVRVIHIGTHPTDALPLIHELGKGGIVAVQLDRAAPSGRGIEVQLFGRAMTFPEGPFRLASMSAVPILPMFVRRLALYDYELVVNEPIRLPPRANAEQLAAAAQQVADAMASFLSASPTQWFHF